MTDQIAQIQGEIDVIQTRISCLQADIYQEEKKLYPLKVRLFELKEGVSVRTASEVLETQKEISAEFPGQGIDCSFPYPPMEV